MSRPKTLDPSKAGNLSTTEISLDHRLLIDQLASDFERHWPLASRQSIESTLQNASDVGLEPECIAELFRELLLIELELLDRTGETLQPSEYLCRFPDRASDIEEICSQYEPLKDRQTKPLQDEASDVVPFSTRYTQEALIARGGMGIVYRGYDSVLQRSVAIKVLDSELLDDEEALKRFRREPITCGNLQHPNIVPIYDSGTTEDGRPYFAMKLIGGNTLAELIDSSQVETGSDAALEIFQQVCHAIASAHRQGVIHRDIKPSNIMVADLGEVYVMDWGLSGILNCPETISSPTTESNTHARPLSGSDYSAITTGGTIFGTPRYMPPELRSVSADRSSKRVDVYCLGAVLCELMVGKTPRQIAESTGPITDSADLRDYLISRGLDSELADIAVVCVHPDPAKRPESADELVQKLETYRKNVRNRIRQAELNAATLLHRNRIIKLRLRVIATILTCLLAVFGFASWSVNRTRAANAKQLASATRSLSSATVAFNIACESATWIAPQWNYAEQLLKVAASEVQQSSDAKLQDELANLQKQFEFMNRLRDAATLRTDVKKNIFFYENKEGTVVDAFAAIDVDTGQEISVVASKLDSLPDGAKRLLLGVLTELVAYVEPLENQAFWNKLTPFLEIQISDTNLAASIIANDIDQLRKCADPAKLEKYTPVSLDVLGHVLKWKNEPDLCERVLRFACNKFPTNFGVNTSLGNFLKDRFPNDPAKAMPFLAIASAIDPKPGALLNYAACLINSGEFELADIVLERLLNDYPDYYYASVQWAKCKNRLGDDDAAIEILEQSARRGSQESFTYLYLAEQYQNRGEFASAEMMLEKGRELVLNHGNTDSFRRLLITENTLGHFGDAFRDVMQILDEYPNADIYFEAATAASIIYEYEKSIELYSKGLKRHPDHPNAIINLGSCLWQLGKFREARSYYVKGHQIGIATPDWDSPSTDWIHRLNACVENVDNLDSVLDKLHAPSATISAIGTCINDLLIPAEKWREAYGLFVKLENEGKFMSWDFKFTSLASEVALRAALATQDISESDSEASPTIEKDALSMQRKAAEWLTLTAKEINANAVGQRARAEKLLALRLFLQSKRGAQFKDPEKLSRLHPEVGETIATAFQQLVDAEQLLVGTSAN